MEITPSVRGDTAAAARNDDVPTSVTPPKWSTFSPMSTHVPGADATRPDAARTRSAGDFEGISNNAMSRSF
ncbi:hypothetical protein GCM10022417_14450 [Corynebacterium pilbarense]